MSAVPSTIEIIGPSPAISAKAFSLIGARTFKDTFGHLYQLDDLDAFLRDKHSEAMYQSLIDDPAIGLWAAVRSDDALVGYGVAGPCDLPVNDMPERSGEFMRFYFDKAYQGAGLGTKMMGEMLDWLDQHFDHSYLSVYQDNPGAQRLYQRHGFKVVQEYFYMVGNHRDPEFIMHRQAR